METEEEEGIRSNQREGASDLHSINGEVFLAHWLDVIHSQRREVLSESSEEP